jgi:hypothetical protein
LQYEETVKPMLSMMESCGMFSTPAGISELWTKTRDHIDIYLPTLKEKLFISPAGNTALI